MTRFETEITIEVPMKWNPNDFRSGYAEVDLDDDDLVELIHQQVAREYKRICSEGLEEYTQEQEEMKGGIRCNR